MHTPGPWIARYHDRVTTQDDTDGTKSVAHIYASGREGRANQRLIAAAPDLYEVAKGYEAWEADVIENADWRAPTPKLTQAQFDRLIELQTARNAALSKASQQQGLPE